MKLVYVNDYTVCIEYFNTRRQHDDVLSVVHGVLKYICKSYFEDNYPLMFLTHNLKENNFMNLTEEELKSILDFVYSEHEEFNCKTIEQFKEIYRENYLQKS